MGSGCWALREMTVSWSPTLPQLQEANAQLAEQACPHDVEMTPVQRRIEPRSADDSLSGVVRCLYFADTFLRDGEARRGTGFGETKQASVGHPGNGQWGRGGTASPRGWESNTGASRLHWQQGAGPAIQFPWNFCWHGVSEGATGPQT